MTLFQYFCTCKKKKKRGGFPIQICYHDSPAGLRYGANVCVCVCLLATPAVSACAASACAAMTDNKRLAFSIIRFLHEQLQSGDLSSGAQESLEGEPPPPPLASPARLLLTRFPRQWPSNVWRRPLKCLRTIRAWPSRSRYPRSSPPPLARPR